MRKSLFMWAFLSLVVTGGLNWMSYKLYLYWTIWWADMVVHFFGGLTVVLAVLWLYDISGKAISGRSVFLRAICGVMIVGILWELFELSFGVTSLADGWSYWSDTISDLIMDATGGLVGFLFAYLGNGISSRNKHE